MKKVLFLILILASVNILPALASYELKFSDEAAERIITYNEDELKFYENDELLSKEQVQALFPDYEIVLVSRFDKDKKFVLKNKRMQEKKILLLNDEKFRTFHLFYVYPVTSRSEFQNFKNGEIKSLITIHGKKNVRLKHSGGDEFILDVK